MSNKFLKVLFIRAFKTFCETLGSMITVGVALNEINWIHAVSDGGDAYLTSKQCTASPVSGVYVGELYGNTVLDLRSENKWLTGVKFVFTNVTASNRKFVNVVVGC